MLLYSVRRKRPVEGRGKRKEEGQVGELSIETRTEEEGPREN